MTEAADNGDVVDNAAYLREWAADIRKNNGKSIDADKLDSIAAEIDEFQRSFDLRWNADMRGIKLWQAAGDGRELTWPDQGDLVAWLLTEIDRLRSLQAVPEGLTFAAFARANRERCESPQGFNHDLGSWTASDWVTAIVGELGEAANIVKKLNRYRDNIPGNKETADALRAKLRREIGDTFVYLDLLCQSLGFVVSEAAVEVFNAKSEEIGYPVVLSASPAPPVASGWQPMGTAPKDGTHFIGNTQWGAREIWWHKDTYEGEYWTDEGDSEPEPTGWIPLPGAAAPQTENDKEAAAAAYFRSAIADGQAAVLLADLATYDNVLRELGIQESHKHPVDEVRRIASLAETTEARGIERAAELIDRKVRDYTADHGSLDPETGTMEFSEAGEEYVSTLDELAEEIRALSAPAAPQTTSIKAPLPDWLGPDTPEQRAKLQAFVEGISEPAPQTTVSSGLSTITKDWCETMARAECGDEIGAGSPNHPLRTLPEQTTVSGGEPVAYLHSLHLPNGEVKSWRSHSKESPWPIDAGEHYTVTPLFAASQEAQPKFGGERLKRCLAKVSAALDSIGDDVAMAGGIAASLLEARIWTTEAQNALPSSSSAERARAIEALTVAHSALEQIRHESDCDDPEFEIIDRRHHQDLETAFQKIVVALRSLKQQENG